MRRLYREMQREHRSASERKVDKRRVARDELKLKRKERGSRKQTRANLGCGRGRNPRADHKPSTKPTFLEVAA